jgi:two-component system, NtrC family, sensor kinase
MRFILSSLSSKLILSIGIIIILGGGISWYTLISSEKRSLMDNAFDAVASYSDIVKKSTRFSMLTYHREAIQQTIEEVGSREEIQDLRIFDGKGKIFYAVDRTKIGLVADKSDPACIGCHGEGDAEVRPLLERQWLIQDRAGGRVLTFIDPVYNEPSCTTACHAHTEGQKVLGILQTDFSLAGVDNTIRKQMINISRYAIFFMVLSAVSLYIVLRKLVLKPLSMIDAAMGKVKEGNLFQTVPVDSRDEIGRLASTFNAMTRELAESRKKMENWTRSLEEGIAEKAEELKRSQGKLIQAEKLASLGRMTADVAHEIRNPLTALGGFARRLDKIVEGEKEKEYTGIMVAEVARLEKILRDVLTFSRDARSNFELGDLEGVVHDSIKVYGNLCREHSITIAVNREEGLMPVLLDRDQVKQAFDNLMSNALDAMPAGGVLSITAGREEMHEVTFMFLQLTDTGSGISASNLPLIFEPFFTTKKIGHGTGLGLSITRKIMEEHGGFIQANSVEGEGSTFTMYFPYQSAEDSVQVQCWEYMKCGRENDCSIKCPAFPNFGRICWVVAGTFCEGKIQGTFAQKYEDCTKCEFHRVVNRKDNTQG